MRQKCGLIKPPSPPDVNWLYTSFQWSCGTHLPEIPRELHGLAPLYSLNKKSKSRGGTRYGVLCKKIQSSALRPITLTGLKISAYYLPMDRVNQNQKTNGEEGWHRQDHSLMSQREAYLANIPKQKRRKPAREKRLQNPGLGIHKKTPTHSACSNLMGTFPEYVKDLPVIKQAFSRSDEGAPGNEQYCTGGNSTKSRISSEGNIPNAPASHIGPLVRGLTMTEYEDRVMGLVNSVIEGNCRGGSVERNNTGESWMSLRERV